jgi:hypothetical protein
VIKWVGLKQRSLHAPYRDSTVRAFYLATFCANGKDILFGGLEQAHALDAARGGALKDAVQSDKSLSDAIDAVLELTTTIDCHLDSGINRMFTVDVDRPRAFDFALDLARADAVEKVIVAIQRRAQAYNHARASTKTREPPALESPPPQVMKALESLASEARLGKADGRWPERLRSVVSEYGYARYSDAKLKLATTDINVLDQYREGYLRLAECLHAAREVSPSVREYIHKTFLLPWNELRQIPKPKPEESDVY